MASTKVLWLANKPILEQNITGTGSWLSPMARHLVETGDVTIGSIAQGDLKQSQHQEMGGIDEWIIPRINQPANGQIPGWFSSEVSRIAREFAPDLVHVWGTEDIWGLLTARGVIDYPTLLEMQGLKHAIARVYAGGLTLREQIACIGVKEVIRRSTIAQGRCRFQAWGRFEQEIIQKHIFITVQTAWMEAQVKAINSSCLLFYNDLILRQPFYEAALWSAPENGPIILTIISYASAFKGLHIALRSLAVLKERLPGVQLRIAGEFQRSGLRQDGYVAWLNREAKRLNVSADVHWLGRLTAPQIIEEMRRAKCMVVPTYIENCSTTTQEAMFIGIPLVLSYTGGLPSLAQENETALFFSPGDVEMCAYQLERLLTQNNLADQISKRARARAVQRNQPDRIILQQINAYRHVVGS